VLDEDPCPPDVVGSDVVLVLDVSSSMLERTSGNRTKLAAAVEAAGGFVDSLQPTADQAALVTFDESARLIRPLTSDKAALRLALATVVTAQFTRIDLGLSEARRELGSPRARPAAQPVVVLLTDGRNNPEPPETAVREAEAARREGIRLFAIGLGADVDAPTLQAMVSRPEDYYFAPDGEDLAAIYAEIARAVEVCPPDDFWPKRPGGR
jgi:Ca-activated chloride channel family protein